MKKAGTPDEQLNLYKEYYPENAPIMKKLAETSPETRRLLLAKSVGDLMIDIAEMYCGKTADKEFKDRIDGDSYMNAIRWAYNHFTVVTFEETPTVDDVLNSFNDFWMKRNKRGLAPCPGPRPQGPFLLSSIWKSLNFINVHQMSSKSNKKVVWQGGTWIT